MTTRELTLWRALAFLTFFAWPAVQFGAQLRLIRNASHSVRNFDSERAG